MLNLDRLHSSALKTAPYQWAAPSDLFAPEDAVRLARGYPRDHFKTVHGHDGEKGYEHEVRCLIAIGANEVSHREDLSRAWQALGDDLLSADYRRAIGECSGVDTSSLLLEANLFYYEAGNWMGPHVDLPAKVVTHVLYFNDAWDEADGGCLTILRSSNADDVEQVIRPLVGQSALLVRSDRSWHAVTRVRPGCLASRTAVTVTFWQPGSASTMWTPHDASPLHWYTGNMTRATWVSPEWQSRPTAVPHY